MQISGKYLKVWEVEDKVNFKLVNLGDSKKNKQGQYENWTWYKTLFVSEAKNVPIQKGDTIEVISGQIYQEKYQDKWYTKLVIFDIAVTEKSDNGNSSNFDDSSIPF